MKTLANKTFTTVFGLAYLGLMTNLLLAIGCSPFLVVLVLTDPARPSVLLAALLPVVAPMLAAAFRVFRAYSVEGSTDVVRNFVAGLRATGLKALALGAAASVALAAFALDAWLSLESGFGTVVLPVLALLSAMVVAVTLAALAALADVPDAPVRQALKCAAILSARRWWLSLASLAMVGTLLLLFANWPALAVGLGAAPVLYGVWANSRYQLRAVLPSEPTMEAAGAYCAN